jgi:hypothetical protein
MSEICTKVHEAETYYVPGSGLMGVPHERMNDIPRLRSEFHAGEAKRAMMLALARRIG